MRLSEFVPIEDAFLDGDSLIESVFGPAFHVVDEAGIVLTTVRNSVLLRRALALKTGSDGMEPAELASALKSLAQQADFLTQAQYDRAAERESLFEADDLIFEDSQFAWRYD